MKVSQRIEWKKSWRDECLKAICAFANAEGGVLRIGRNDKGVAVGVRDARKLLQDIPNKVRGIYKDEYYYRSGSTNQALKGAALDRFLMRKVGRHWDGVPVPHVAIKDLSRAAIGSFRKQARESRRLDAAILRESTPGLLDKLEATGRSPLRNPGELPHNWTLAKLKGKHPSERHEHGGLWVESRFPQGVAGGTTQDTTQEKILALLGSAPTMTRRQLSKQLGISDNGVKYHLDKLKSKGALRHTGPTKGGRWQVLK